jgi:uridine kinase
MIAKPLSFGSLGSDLLLAARSSPLAFWSGVLIRMVLLVSVIPVIRSELFLPFLLGSFGEGFAFDPWTAHVASGGASNAFPYGPAMYALAAPFAKLGASMGEFFGASSFAGASAGLGVLLLCADVAILGAAIRIGGSDPSRLVRVLWLSPIALYVSFWHGQLDAIPVALLLLSVLLLGRGSAFCAGAVLAAALSAKLSMGLAAPFLLLWLLNDERRQGMVSLAAKGFLSAAIPLLLFPSLSPGFRAMVLGTPEAGRLFETALDLGRGMSIFIAPVALFALLVAARRSRRPTTGLLCAQLAAAFFAVLLLTPAAPGWFLWALPFVAMHDSPRRSRLDALLFGFGAAFLSFHLSKSAGASFSWGSSPVSFPFDLSDGQASSMILTAMAAIGAVLIHRVWTEAAKSADRFGLSSRPCLVGVSGDSGAGKDTLVDALVGLIGEESTARVSGDDYHLWDRYGPMWRRLTHLNPRANDLRRFASDALSLVRGEGVRCRHYDHGTGRFAKPYELRPRPFVMASGLHALFMAPLRRRCNLRVFLSMDENLRRFLKLQRDVLVRGHSREKVLSSIAARQADGDRFVRPQEQWADVVFSLQPVNEDFVDAERLDPRRVPMKLRMTLRSATYGEELVRGLVGLCGLHVDVLSSDSADGMEIIAEGDAVAEDYAQLASTLVADCDQLLCEDPKWEDGLLGAMQLVCLLDLAERLSNGETA